MNEAIRDFTRKVGIPRLIISLFFVFLCISSVSLGLPFASLSSDTLRRLV